MTLLKIVLSFFVLAIALATGQNEGVRLNCRLPPNIQEEINNKKSDVDEIIKLVLEGNFKGKSYKKLADFVDKFGQRVTGADSLEQSIDYMVEYMKTDGLDVKTESVEIPSWSRGAESAMITSPRQKPLHILGLGESVRTPEEGIEAEVLVVTSFEELEAKKAEAAGKIVVFNQPYDNYHTSVPYRTRGANEAAKVNAVAVLIRSIAPFSLDTPHTGHFFYDAQVTKIPAACITIEDGELLYRLSKMGQPIKIKLTLLPTIGPNPKSSKNAIGDYLGKSLPDEHVIVSAHIDSWDVGQGAMDDGGGVILSAEVHNVLETLKLHPRRTIRTILWTAEEFGLIGGKSYAANHKADLDKISAAFESDSGTFDPFGLDYSGSLDAGCILQAVLDLAPSLNAGMLRKMERVSTDIVPLQDEGVPGVSLNSDETRYFWYHHTEADTMTLQDSDKIDECLALYTYTSYVIADLSIKLPRGNSSEWIIDPDDNAGISNSFNFIILLISLFPFLYL